MTKVESKLKGVSLIYGTPIINVDMSIFAHTVESPSDLT